MPRIIDNIIGVFKSEDQRDNDRPHDAHASVIQKSSSDVASTSTDISDIPANILAFRTITTILSQLPRTKPIEPIDNLDHLKMNREDRREIRIYDAFAHLAAGENDVAALTTNQKFADGTDELSVVTCTQANGLVGETPLPISTPGKIKDKIDVWYLMLTRNFRRHDPGTSSGAPHPTIVPSSEPNDLGERTAFEYMVGLEERW